MVIFKFTFFRVRQKKRNLVRRQWIDVKFDVMGMQRIHVYIWNYFFDSRVKPKILNGEKRLNRQSSITVYATFYRSIMTLKWHFYTSWLFIEMNQEIKYSVWC